MKSKINRKHQKINLAVQQAAFEQEKAVAVRRSTRTPVAYRVRYVQNGKERGSLVLCEKHLEKERNKYKGDIRLTGETFPVRLCDHCHPEES